MLHSSERIIKHKLGLLNLAEELGNVSEACQAMGLSRDTFYRYKSAVEDGVVPKSLTGSVLSRLQILTYCTFVLQKHFALQKTRLA